MIRAHKFNKAEPGTSQEWVESLGYERQEGFKLDRYEDVFDLPLSVGDAHDGGFVIWLDRTDGTFGVGYHAKGASE